MKMKNSKLKIAIIRQELLELTGDYRQALILNQFIYWTSRVRDYDLFLQEEHERKTNKEVEFRNGWIYKTAEELSEETMLGLSPSNMRKHIKELVKKGWVQERRNPKYKWDKTLQYRVDTLKLNKDLYNLGYSINIDGDYRVSVLENGVIETENQTTQNETAIPEITTEIKNNEIRYLHPPAEDGGVLKNIYNINDDFIQAYLRIMGEFGYSHKRVREKNIDYILEATALINGEGIELKDWEDKVCEHFEKLPKNNDGDILAFLSTSKRYFEVIDVDYETGRSSC